jgi:lipopolysaccharide export system ATP-binding protein
MDTLQASHLAKTYKGRQVVRDVSLNISQGEIVGLLGPNGAGKTTCFYMMVGLVAADTGQVTISDTNLTAMPIHQRAANGLAYLPQDSSIFRTLSVEENILAILETRTDLSSTDKQRKLESLLTEFLVANAEEPKLRARSPQSPNSYYSTNPSLVLTLSQ